MTATIPITIEIDNRLAENIRASQVYTRTTFWGKFDKVAAIFFLLIGLANFMIGGFNWQSIVPVLFALIIWLDLWPRVRYYFIFKTTPRIHELSKMTFTTEGIHLTTPIIDSHLSWLVFSKLLEDEQLFLLIYGKGTFFVIPKRVFKDAAEQDAFRELAGRMIGQGKEKA